MHSAFRGSRRLWAGISASVLAVAAIALLGLGSAASAHSSHAGHHHAGHHGLGGRHHGGSGGGGKGAPGISSAPWGTVGGQNVNLYTLTSGHGMTVKITNYGGVVQSIWAPGRGGQTADVSLGFSKLSDYVDDFTQTSSNPWPAAGGSGDTYFGAIIGRYANRIADHSFTLDGMTYNLPANNDTTDTLHGGPDSWNTKVWGATTSTSKNGASLQLTYTDPDGYNGFPGQVTATVTYTVTKDNALQIHYNATTTKPTVINLTNHTYFNLAGEGSGTVYDQLLKINSNTFQPTNTAQIPTGFASVAGTPFDFRTLHPIGENINRADLPQGDQLTVAHGYDFNWVLNGTGMKLASFAEDPASGRTLTTYTTEPGLQLYTANYLVGDLVGTSGRTYRQGDAFTLETQHYPDSPHHIGDSQWPSVVLNPGTPFNSTTIYKFGTAGRMHRHRA
jgi:aldose 1-epimerase